MKIFRYLMLTCLVLLSGTRMAAQTHWTCDDRSFEYDMSMFLNLNYNGTILSDLDQYEVGAFVGTECRGVSTVGKNSDGSSYLYLRIRSNVQSGEEVNFKFYNSLTGEEKDLDTKVAFKHRASEGMPSAPKTLIRLDPVTVSATATEGGTVQGGGNYFVTNEVTLKAVPNEGWHFVQWSDGTQDSVYTFKVMQDVTIEAQFERTVYTLTLNNYDGTEFVKQDYFMGDVISLPEAPEREGYTFNTWGDVPATMPAKNLEFTAQYTINSYVVKFVADGVELYNQKQDYGTAITIPDAPAKEGYTFVTWGDVPATVPAHDVEFVAEYKVNQYHIKFIAEGKVVSEADLDYGVEIVAPDAPAKEGYSFVTWGDVPATMPAKDLEFTAEYSINSYVVKFVADGVELYNQKQEYGSAIVVPDAPAKEGYTFVTWGDVPATVPAHDVEFVAEYKVNQYHVKFIAEGNVVSETDLDYGVEIVAPDAPAKEGYSFVTWGDVPATMPAKDLEFTAEYSINSYVVKFVADGVELYNQTQEYGSAIVVPDAPAKEGYSFVTWGDVPATVPAHDVEFVAEYKVNQYHVKFIAEGNVVSEADLDYGAKITVPEAPAKEGYTFKTWGDVPETMPAKDLEFTAQYDKGMFNVKFVAEGKVVFEQKMKYGDKITVPEAPAKEGYSFVTWGDVPATVPAHDVEFTAEYKVNQYHVKFIAEGNVVSEADLDFGAKITVPEAPAKEGYNFVTWGDVPETMPAKDLEFTAQYDKGMFNVKFVAEGKVVFEQKMKYGDKITVPEAPVKEGYSFVTWGDVPETVPAHDVEFTAEYKVNQYHVKFIAEGVVVSEADLDFGAKITVPEAPAKEGHTFKTWGDVPETMPAKDLEFTAQYDVNSYTVKFIADGVEVYNQKQAFGSEIVVPEAPAKEGYTFKTWGDVPATVPAHDVEFTAEYKVNQYHVKFIADEKIVSEADIDFGAKITVPEAPEKEGYTFFTWGDVPATMPAKDLEFTAEYTVNQYEITYYVDGELYDKQTVSYGAAIEPIAAPEKTGYEFLGWENVPETMPAHDIDIQGKMKAIMYKITYMLNDEFYGEQSYAYGDVITPLEVKVEDYETFSGWNDLPETMPAEDITVYGVKTITDAIDAVLMDMGEVTIYTIKGNLLYRNVMYKDVIKKLRPGMYIINGKKVAIK